MYRVRDESGVSGTGCILEGVVFHTGETVVSWITKYKSLGIYPSFDEFKAIHIDIHPTNETKIVWDKVK